MAGCVIKACVGQAKVRNIESDEKRGEGVEWSILLHFVALCSVVAQTNAVGN